MMSLETAKEKWKLSTNTILSYVADGLIEGVVIDTNNMLLFPDIPKPKKSEKMPQKIVITFIVGY